MSILKVYCNNLESNPHCLHGPTLLFSRQIKGIERKFYACSAYRNRKDCSFFQWEDEKFSKRPPWKENAPNDDSNINHKQLFLKLLEFKNVPEKDRQFCQTCFNFVFPSDKCHKNHRVIKGITDNLLTYPSHFITPIESSKKEAQFWFDENSKHFIINCLKLVGTLACLCIGVPTVHEILRKSDINSILLDIDKRYYHFYSENSFCWFNMFNCHFMANSEMCKGILNKYLSNTKVGVIIDPPFGARIEPLANTINLFLKQTSKLNIFLILPYFMENHVLKYFPSFHMLDYQVQYTNHRKFSKFDTKNKPSPVRIFTNVLPSLLKMPKSEGYYFCKECKCWRSKNNKHCKLCKLCPSKNGAPYKHCEQCSKCVKQTWLHCSKCNRCNVPGHKCYNQNESKKRPNEFVKLTKFSKMKK